MSRSRVLLLLFLVLLLALWYAWKETPRQQRVASTAVQSLSPAAGKKAASVATSLDFSGGEKLPYRKPKRDIFRSLYRAPVIKKQDIVQVPQPEPVVVNPLPPPPIVDLEPEVRVPTSAPIPPLSVLGFLRKGPTTTVFLASQQGDLYLVKKGDRFADGLLVRELDASSMVVSRGRSDAGITLKIGEQKMQRVSMPQVPSDRPDVPVINDFAPNQATPPNEGGQAEEEL